MDKCSQIHLVFFHGCPLCPPLCPRAPGLAKCCARNTRPHLLAGCHPRMSWIWGVGGVAEDSTTPYQMKGHLDICFSDLQRMATSGPSRQLHHSCFHPMCPLSTAKPFRVPREWREAQRKRLITCEMPMLGLTAALQHVTAPCIWDTISTSEFYSQRTICSTANNALTGGNAGILVIR